MAGFLNSGNFSSLLNIIERNRSGIGNSIQKIASGRRLGRAGEDPASNAIATRLRSDIRALTQAVKNVDSGVNFISTAEGGLAGISDLVARGRELAIQASNGTLSDTQRQALNQEFTQVKKEIDRISQSTEFNGQGLLDGTLGSESDTRVDIQAGTGSDSANQINLNIIERTDTETLGLGDTDISSSTNALQAFEALGQASETVLATRGKVGATANRLVTTASGLGTQIENLTRSESVLADTDVAEEISTLRQTLLRFETSIRTLALELRHSEQVTGRLLDFTA